MRAEPIYVAVVDGKVLSGYIEDVTAELEINGLPADAVLMTVLVSDDGKPYLAACFDPFEPENIAEAVEELTQRFELPAEA